MAETNPKYAWRVMQMLLPDATIDIGPRDGMLTVDGVEFAYPRSFNSPSSWWVEMSRRVNAHCKGKIKS